MKGIKAMQIGDLTKHAVESQFRSNTTAPTGIEWQLDNGSCYAAAAARLFAHPGIETGDYAGAQPSI